MPRCQHFRHETLGWKIFNGCWHSYHLICLNGENYCPLCKSHLHKEVNRLGKVAQEGIFGDNQGTNNGGENDTDADCENDPDDLPATEGFDPGKQIELQNIQPKIPGTTKPSSAGIQVKPVDKPSHCKKCGHIVRGHKGPRNQPVQCSSCPNNLCNTAGQAIACKCKWHQPVEVVPYDNEPLLVSVRNNVTVLSFPEGQS